MRGLIVVGFVVLLSGCLSQSPDTFEEYYLLCEDTGGTPNICPPCPILSQCKMCPPPCECPAGTTWVYPYEEPPTGCVPTTAKNTSEETNAAPMVKDAFPETADEKMENVPHKPLSTTTISEDETALDVTYLALTTTEYVDYEELAIKMKPPRPHQVPEIEVRIEYGEKSPVMMPSSSGTIRVLSPSNIRAEEYVLQPRTGKWIHASRRMDSDAYNYLIKLVDVDRQAQTMRIAVKRVKEE